MNYKLKRMCNDQIVVYFKVKYWKSQNSRRPGRTQTHDIPNKKQTC